ncbi:hypothetical protein ABLA30_01300, partial [Xenorhabdus nematophila]|uniref:hypothetical protein n=1 Tax=Xenorhabdus nematophila TaxID=628 RepID=UPI0032B82B13
MANYEVSRDIVYKDTRSPSEKAYQKLKNLNVFRFLILLLILTLLLIPGLWPLHLVIACIFASFLADLSINLPLRVPKDLGGQDPSEFFTVSKKWNVLDGVVIK